MNKSRRARLAKVRNMLDDAMSELEDILFEEEMVFDNMPENLQESQRAMDMENNVEQMSEAVSSIEQAIDAIDEVQ